MVNQPTQRSNHVACSIGWMPTIPAEWNINRAKWMFTKVNRDVRPEDKVVTCFRDGQVTLRSNRRTSGFTESLKEIGYQGIRKGDLVIHAMDAFAGAIGVSDSDGKGTPVYSVCEPRVGISAHYYAFVVRIMANNGWIQSLATGIRERSTDFRYDTFADQYLPVPPPDEQAAIVRYLDFVDRRIRRYIRAKQKLIALLEEQKQVIIHHAVTSGLNPDVRMKPSGVEWLREVPEHWGIKKMASLFRFSKGKNAAQLTKEYIGAHPGHYPVYSGQTDNDGLMGTYHDFEFDPPQPVVLVTTVGAKAMTTRVISGRFSLSQNCAVIAPRDNSTCSQFYHYVFQPMFNYERASISQIMQPSLRFSDLRRFQIPVPSISEQTAILGYISKLELAANESVDRTKKGIALLQEYRARLIADVVTGKLDVREAAAALPPEDPEITDDTPLDSDEAEELDEAIATQDDDA